MTSNQLVTLTILLGLILALCATLLAAYRRIKSTLQSVGNPELLDRETNLYNDVYFSKVATASIDAFERYQSPFTLLIFNFDAKLLNKLKPGDKTEALSLIGSKVREAIRGSDKAGRPSADSIAILLYGTEGKHAKPVIGRVVTVFGKVLPAAKIRITTWSTPDDIGLIRLYLNK
jgi:GGDEF domain-containing protein